MALPGLGDVVEVAVVHEFNNAEEQINVFHFKVAVAGTGDDEDFGNDLRDLFEDWYVTIEQDITSLVDMVELRWRNVTDDGPQQFRPWDGGYTGGTGSGDSLPPANCALILLRTGVKRVQGKKYMPTFTESTQAYGIWGAGTLGRLGALATKMATPWDGDATTIQLAPHVYSRAQADSFPVVAGQARPLVATQKRRKAGRGS